MNNKLSTKIQNIEKINIHHQSNLPSPIYSILQLNTGIILLGLENSEIYFFTQTNIETPYFLFQLDQYPIRNMIPLSPGLILCSTDKPALYILIENKIKMNIYDKKEKIDTNNSIFKQINKMIILINDNLVMGDNKFVSFWNIKEKKAKLIKQIKIGFPVMDILYLKDNNIVCGIPNKQSLIFIDTDKMVQKYEINDIKFLPELNTNNLMCKLNKDMLLIGGCVGVIYIINLKTRQFIANVSLKIKDEVITSLYKMDNGDILGAVSMIYENTNEKNEKNYEIASSLVQYKYDGKSFYEFMRKSNIHSDFVRNVVEIVNHKGISEIGTISLDRSFNLWD